jgi:hypothetical protein
LLTILLIACILSNANKLQNAKNPKKKFTSILKTTKPALLTIEERKHNDVQQQTHLSET